MTVDFAVVDTGGGLSGRRVLVPTSLLFGIDQDREEISTKLTADEIKNSPYWDSRKPVYREHLSQFGPETRPSSKKKQQEENHLRSVREVCTYAAWGTDAKLGVMVDFFIEDTEWTMPYLLVETIAEHSLAKTVVVQTAAICSISWENKRVGTDLTRNLFLECPYFPSKAGESRRNRVDVQRAIIPGSRTL